MVQCINLKGELAKKGITIEELARFLGIHRNSVSNKINGDSSFTIHLSEGYICKLHKRASKALKSFVGEVRLECIRSKILHWDDTVIFVNTDQACINGIS